MQTPILTVTGALLCRSTTEVQEQQAAESGARGNRSGGAPDHAADRELRRSASEARMAVAAKISAARALARKLCEEKEAAMAAARAAAEHSLDEEEIERCCLSLSQWSLLNGSADREATLALVFPSAQIHTLDKTLRSHA